MPHSWDEISTYLTGDRNVYTVKNLIQDRAFEKILEAEDPTVATATFDFAMKFLPRSFHETTNQW